MPCVNISTNSVLECVDTWGLHTDIAKAVAKIMNKDENHVMTCFKVAEMGFGGSICPAAYGELISVEGLNPTVNKQLVAAISHILHCRLRVPKNRFILKLSAPKGTFLGYNGSTV